MTLFVNACVKNDSRTRRLAQHCLKGPYEEVKLHEIVFPIADEAFIKKRDKLIASQEFDNPMFNLARQFANADEIVIAAPYWDLSFPASLKQYIEQIRIAKEVLHSRRYNESLRKLVKGLMIESYLEDGCQKPGGGVYGQSITDPCLGWEKTEKLVLDISEAL